MDRRDDPIGHAEQAATQRPTTAEVYAKAFEATNVVAAMLGLEPVGIGLFSAVSCNVTVDMERKVG